LPVVADEEVEMNARNRSTLPRSAVWLLCATALAACVGSSPPPAPARPAAGPALREAPVPPLPPEGQLACARPDEFGPVLVPLGAYRARTGVGIGRLSELTTTKERPLEECGLRTVLIRLATLRCNDGSNPFGDDLRQAHASRAGNVGPGGRCDSIIDRYVVKCPEAAYDVFADMYFCAPGAEGAF
jgi:hypothetical protein